MKINHKSRGSWRPPRYAATGRVPTSICRSCRGRAREPCRATQNSHNRQRKPIGAKKLRPPQPLPQLCEGVSEIIILIGCKVGGGDACSARQHTLPSENRKKPRRHGNHVNVNRSLLHSTHHRAVAFIYQTHFKYTPNRIYLATFFAKKAIFFYSNSSPTRIASPLSA